MLTRDAQDVIYSSTGMDNHRLPGSKTTADIQRLESGVTRFYEGDLEFYLSADGEHIERLNAEFLRLLKKS
jgi:hypothetical protein